MGLRGGTGRRDRLKIYCPLGRAGSSPAEGTISNLIKKMLKKILNIAIAFFLLIGTYTYAIDVRRIVPDSQYFKVQNIDDKIDINSVKRFLRSQDIESILIGKTLLVVNTNYKKVQKVLELPEFGDYQVVEGNFTNDLYYYKELYGDCNNVVLIDFSDNILIRFITEDNEVMRYAALSTKEDSIKKLLQDVDAFLKLEDRLYKYPVSQLIYSIIPKKWMEISKKVRLLSEKVRVLSISSNILEVSLTFLEGNKLEILSIIEEND